MGLRNKNCDYTRRSNWVKVIDPVCKMTIEDKNAVVTSTYKGTKYYFCAAGCKEAFDKDPNSFL